MSGFRFGPQLSADGVTFRLWAPAARSVELMVERPLGMAVQGGGWYALDFAGYIIVVLPDNFGVEDV